VARSCPNGSATSDVGDHTLSRAESDNLSPVLRQLLQSAFARLGPVSRRDQRIADLTRRANQLEKERRRLAWGPSYEVRLEEERRLRAWESELGAPNRSVIAGGKFHVYDLVRSHGIDVPEQFGRWHDPADIPWDELPDAVVIKSAFGAATRGVLPLRRVDGGWQVATRDATVTSEQLTADLAALAAMRKARPPFGAEEFLDDGSGTVPVDIKVYTFYGEAPVARLRRVIEHRPGGAGAHRVVDRNGTDFDTYHGKPTDPTIPLPGALADLFDVAERVSIVIRAPFSRIDLYDIRGRIVFGEVTPCPGSRGGFGPALDITMGEAWERAQVRLWRDLAAGVSREVEWGPLGAPAGEETALPRVDIQAPGTGHTPRPAHKGAPTEELPPRAAMKERTPAGQDPGDAEVLVPRHDARREAP
jgi:hypothetical protein